MAPSYLSSLICVATPSCYSLCSTWNGTLLRFPLVKSSKTLGDRAFMLAAPKLWNSLLLDIRTTMSLSSFKIKLKSFLFVQVFQAYVLNFYAPVNSSCAHPPPPPGQLRGICMHCQSRGSGISLPKGYPRAFDTHVVSDSKSKRRRFYRKRPVVCH